MDSNTHSLHLCASHYSFFPLLFMNKLLEACLNYIETPVFEGFWCEKYKFCLFKCSLFWNNTTECKNSCCNLVWDKGRIHNQMLELLFKDSHFQISIQILESHQRDLSVCNKDLNLSNSELLDKWELFPGIFIEKCQHKFPVYCQTQFKESRHSLSRWDICSLLLLGNSMGMVQLSQKLLFLGIREQPVFPPFSFWILRRSKEEREQHMLRTRHEP